MKIEQRIRIDRANGRAPIFVRRRDDDPDVYAIEQASSRIFLTSAEFDTVADAIDALSEPALGKLQAFRAGDGDA